MPGAAVAVCDSVKFKDVNDKYQPKTDIPIVKEYWDNQKKIIQESNKKYLKYLRLNPKLNSEEKRLKMYEIKWETELKYLPEEYKLMCCTKLSE
ncbi:hypothetical protein Emin_0466 [Elusimicrobium minutum Pei191]|uniref:Uncharacterized protein n=1 Tax=Elusimicrobium minutum (strain Pei191) TaxID=445932 RepID=B2KBK1_ELUMP|nr:hypothetical protein [Elusimicrobium minutum]ACC98023.1 hypothetical protein Emin_0466 [Elusimicrobium minutum Pei191]